MKTRLIFLGIFTVILFLIIGNDLSRKKEETWNCNYGPLEETTIWIAADPHYLSPELTDHGTYFRQIVEHADGKVTEYSEELTETFVEEVITQKPDALILPGDLTFNGALQSHLDLSSKLQRIADAGISVLVLPGNHDLENPMAATFQGSGYKRTDSITAVEFSDLYSVFINQAVLSRDTHSLSYTAELTSGIRVLLVDVNTTDVPGEITNSTLIWVEQQIRDAIQSGVRLLAVSHQNLLQHNSIFSEGYIIKNGTRLLTLYEKYGVLCNLSGHMHIQHIAQSANGFLEIAGSSLAVSPNQYGILTLNGTQADYRTKAVDVSSWAKNQNLTDKTLLNFEQYSHEFFAETTEQKVNIELADPANASQLADFFVKVNTAYFAGRMDTIDWDRALYDQWQRRTSFTAFYLKSIADDTFQNQTLLSFDF